MGLSRNSGRGIAFHGGECSPLGNFQNRLGTWFTKLKARVRGGLGAITSHDTM